MSTPKAQRWTSEKFRREYKGYVLEVSLLKSAVVSLISGPLNWEWRAMPKRMEDEDGYAYARDEKEAKLKARRFVDAVRRHDERRQHALTLRPQR